MNKRYLMLLTAFAVCLGSTSSAFADNDHRRGHAYGHDKKEYWNKKWDKSRYDRNDYHFNGTRPIVYHPRQPVVVIHPRDRVAIRDYYATRPVVYYRDRTPAYHIGYRLPHYVPYQRISPRLLGRLQPVPVGYEYVRVDNDVLLINSASRLILDALTLL